MCGEGGYGVSLRRNTHEDGGCWAWDGGGNIVDREGGGGSCRVCERGSGGGGEEYCSRRDRGASQKHGEEAAGEGLSHRADARGKQITKARPHMPCEVLSNPEFLSEGEAVKNLLNPDRVLLGPSMTSPGYAAASTLASIYSSWIDPAKIQVMSSTSAELAKLAANAMLAQRISSINAISTICERTCADIADVQAALGSDSRIGSDYLQASIGFGGSCLKKDLLNLVYLTRSLNLPNTGEYWLHVLRMNHFQTANLVQRVVSRLDGSLSDKKVAILGWTFKRGTSDTRDTRSAHVLKMLLENSATEIAIFDPGCNPADIQEEVYSVKRSVHTNPKGLDNNVLVHENPYAACQGADATLVLTDWDHFRCPPGPGKPFLVPLGDAEKVDAFGSASDISWTDCASSEIGLSLSMLSIGDTDQFDHRKSFVRNPLGRLKPDRPCPSNCRDCTKPSWWGETNHRVDWRRIAAEMKSPRWVFDGRNVVDIGEMGRMGFRVEALGKASAWGPF